MLGMSKPEKSSLMLMREGWAVKVTLFRPICIRCYKFKPWNWVAKLGSSSSRIIWIISTSFFIILITIVFTICVFHNVWAVVKILNLIMTATRYGRMTTNAVIRSSLLSKLLVTLPLGVQLLLDKHTIHNTYNIRRIVKIYFGLMCVWCNTQTVLDIF